MRRRSDEVGQPRFWMLETIREFAAEQLEEADDADAMRGRLADWVLALATRAEVGLLSSSLPIWLATLEEELESIRAVHSILEATGQVEAQLDLVYRLWNFWFEGPLEGGPALGSGAARRESR